MTNLGYAENPQPLWMFGGRRVAPGQPYPVSAPPPPFTTRTPSRPWISGVLASWPITSAPTYPYISAPSLLCWPFPLRSLHPMGGGCSPDLPTQAELQNLPAYSGLAEPLWPSCHCSAESKIQAGQPPAGAHLCRAMRPSQDFEPWRPQPAVSVSASLAQSSCVGPGQAG